jgi:FkbM family methyltransferase
MRVFDIGFYDGKDSAYYLKRGFEVIAFEANPVLYEAGRETFPSEIAAGQLQLYNLGIGAESGKQVEFFLHTEVDEWSTFYRQAAMNWGPGKSKMIRVPCITPEEMFAQFGDPDYLKCDIEGYDILVAKALKHVAARPGLVSFEASNVELPKELVLAGYQSFKLVDQARVPLQHVQDPEHAQVFDFSGGTGPFGDDAEGEWISFEHISYLYQRFVLDPFSSSTPAGHWFDIHASLNPPRLDRYQQNKYLREFIEDMHGGHCGMQDFRHTPRCPALDIDRSANEAALPAETDSLRMQLNEIHSSRAWRAITWYRRVTAPLIRLLRKKDMA